MDDPANRVTLEVLKPEFDGEDATTLTTVTYFLSLRYSRTGKVWLVTDVPLAQGDIDIEPGLLEYAYTPGNPYMGGAFLIRSPDLFGEIGLRIPLNLVKDKNRSVALATDPVDRIEAFMPDMIPLRTLVTYRWQRPARWAVQLRGGPAFWFFGGSPKQTRMEMVWLYNLKTIYTFDRWRIASGLSGLWVLTDQVVDGVVLTEPHTRQYDLSVSAKVGGPIVGAQIRMPLNKNLRSIQDFVLGLHVSIPLGEPYNRSSP